MKNTPSVVCSLVLDRQRAERAAVFNKQAAASSTDSEADPERTPTSRPRSPLHGTVFKVKKLLSHHIKKTKALQELMVERKKGEKTEKILFVEYNVVFLA